MYEHTPTTTHLDGKVVHKKLPLLEPPVGADAPLLKRLNLPQGELAQFHDGSVGIRYMAWVDLRPGTVRGNHFHKIKREFMYLISGEVDLWVQETASDGKATLRMNAGDLVWIDAQVAHTVVPISAGHAIEFSEAPFDSQDTYRCVIFTP